MTPKTKKRIVLVVLCALGLGMAIWHSLTYNEGRIVYPIEADYTFQWLDLPMVLAVGVTVCYYLYLSVLFMMRIIKERKQQFERSRTLNPKLGWCGFLGLLGFAGFWTYSTDGLIFPFVFFVFFGFFGFFYEGKMSGTFKDERFIANAEKAQLKALKIGFMLIFILLLLAGGQRFLNLSAAHSSIFMISVLSLIYALVLFLSEYFLYQYDVLGKGIDNG